MSKTPMGFVLLQDTHCYAGQWPWISAPSPYRCAAEPGCTTSSRWVQAIYPWHEQPKLVPCAQSKVRPGWVWHRSRPKIISCYKYSDNKLSAYWGKLITICIFLAKRCVSWLWGLFGKIFKRLSAALVRSQGRRQVAPWEGRILFCSMQICIELLGGENRTFRKTNSTWFTFNLPKSIFRGFKARFSVEIFLSFLTLAALHWDFCSHNNVFR